MYAKCMPSRNITFAPGEYYHLCNRGLDGRLIASTDREYARLLFLIVFLQSTRAYSHPSREVSDFIKTGKFLDVAEEQLIASERTVSLVCFCIMKNHFHLLVREEIDDGISWYLQRIENAYTRYFNLSHERRGHLFQGPFRAVHIETNDQLLYTSAYIHRNPREIKKWKDREHLYQWSSLSDYIATKSRWPSLLCQEPIMSQFDNGQDYKNYVSSSIAKLSPEELNELNLSNIGGWTF